MGLLVLLEHSVGYALFRVKEMEEVGATIPEVELTRDTFSQFKSVVTLYAFRPFNDAMEALNNCNAVSEGLMTDELRAFLVSNLTSKNTLGVVDPTLGNNIKNGIECKITHTGVVPEVVRGVRYHLSKYIEGLTPKAMKQSELGLGHAYSRSKVKFNVNRVDNMIIQSIAINDQMDKDLNTFAMRMREWYAYHFPELSKIVPDHGEYARVMKIVQNKDEISDELLPELTEVLHDENRAKEVISAARMSMGMDIKDDDLTNINIFADRIIRLTDYRKNMTGYLSQSMKNVAPNLGVVVGDQIAARLISHAGSLTNLAKMPASTVQILGAEKALFRALKTKTKTPKYGLIYNCAHIGKASARDKGRISRFLANKCSMACRIDNFSETLTSEFGESLRAQIDERIQFYATGDIPRKNAEVMSETYQKHIAAVEAIESSDKKTKKKRKVEVLEESVVENGHSEDASKKKKKKKKNKQVDESSADTTVFETTQELDETVENGDHEDPPKKKKKKKKDKALDESVMDTTQEDPTPASLEEVEPSKKKKKKKNKDVNGSVMETTQEDMDLTSETPKKKKKKNKVIDA